MTTTDDKPRAQDRLAAYTDRANLARNAGEPVHFTPAEWRDIRRIAGWGRHAERLFLGVPVVLDEARPDELLALIGRLADDDPLTRSCEGLDDGCFFCGVDSRYEGGPRASYYWAEHEAECAWVEARQLLGHDLAPHKVKAP